MSIILLQDFSMPKSVRLHAVARGRSITFWQSSRVWTVLLLPESTYMPLFASFALERGRTADNLQFRDWLRMLGYEL